MCVNKSPVIFSFSSENLHATVVGGGDESVSCSQALFRAFFLACVKLLTVIDFSQVEKIEKKLEAITMRDAITTHKYLRLLYPCVSIPAWGLLGRFPVLFA